MKIALKKDNTLTLLIMNNYLESLSEGTLHVGVQITHLQMLSYLPNIMKLKFAVVFKCSAGRLQLRE